MKMGVQSKMGELRLNCEKEMETQHHKTITSLDSFRNSLRSQLSIAQTTHQNQVKLGKLKAQLRAVEDDLVKALSLKTRKEAKRMTMMDSLAATKARVDKLKRAVEEQKTRKDEYAEIMSQQSKACEEKCKKDSESTEEVEEAIAWYNRVLGFRIECGHGIKFIFSNINPSDPKEECSFTIRHANDVYTLLDCDPYLDDTKELITELNKSNGLFQFVRTMRERFQATTCGTNPNFVIHEQDTSTISPSAPVSSIFTGSRSQSPVKQKALQAGDSDRLPKKVNRGKGRLSAIMSPEYSSVRRSPRLTVRK